MDNIVFPAILDGFQSLKDGSIKLTIVTNDGLSNDTAGRIFAMRNQYVGCVLSKTNIAEDFDEIPELPQARRLPGEKSESQKLRGSIWHYFKASGRDEKEEDFDAFYKDYLTQLRQRISQKIKEINPDYDS